MQEFELAVGSSFYYDSFGFVKSKKIVVVYDENKGKCNDCFFRYHRSGCFNLKCFADKRTDEKPVRFEEITE